MLLPSHQNLALDFDLEGKDTMVETQLLDLYGCNLDKLKQFHQAVGYQQSPQENGQLNPRSVAARLHCIMI